MAGLTASVYVHLGERLGWGDWFDMGEYADHRYFHDAMGMTYRGAFLTGYMCHSLEQNLSRETNNTHGINHLASTGSHINYAKKCQQRSGDLMGALYLSLAVLSDHIGEEETWHFGSPFLEKWGANHFIGAAEWGMGMLNGSTISKNVQELNKYCK
jgi:hypothetical protein